MKQPSKIEITEKIKDAIAGKTTRESVGDWVRFFVNHDEDIDITDLDAWHYLVAIGCIDLGIAPNEYLYSDDDLMDIANKYITINDYL